VEPPHHAACSQEAACFLWHSQAEELRAGLDSPPLVLAAAICILVFERHTPKEKITPGKVAKSAGQEHDQVMERYIEP
jgi:hypothetical protein